VNSINSDIENYISYFEKELTKIELLDPLYSKILLFSILDTISRPIYQEEDNHNKFLKYIADFTNWDNSKRVSLIQLYWKLKEEPKLITNCLCKNLGSRLKNSIGTKNFNFCKEINLIDPFDEELLCLVENDNETEKINKSKHAELLYNYRNHLVHEFRTPGYGFETDNSEPYYTFFFRRYDLVYPKQFLLNLVSGSLVSLKLYLLKNQINPYDCYNFTSLWKRT